MVDGIPNNFSEHVNSTDTFCNGVYERTNNLPEEDRTGKPTRYTLTHDSPSTTCIIINSIFLTAYELHYSQTKWLGPNETTYDNSSGISTPLTYVEQDFN